MALETLVDLTKVNNFNVITMDDLKITHPDKFSNNSGQMDYKWFENEIRPNNFIYIRHDVNSLSFTLQNGPISANGVNGCQVDEIITVSQKIVEGLNEKFPCKENSKVIEALDTALYWLNKRKEDRSDRNVEGKDEL